MLVSKLIISITLWTVVRSAPSPYFTRSFVRTPTSSYEQYLIVPDSKDIYRVPVSQVHHYSDFEFPKQQVVHYNPSGSTNQHELHSLQKDNPLWQQMLLNLYSETDENFIMQDQPREVINENQETTTLMPLSTMQPIIVASDEHSNISKAKSDHRSKVSENNKLGKDSASVDNWFLAENKSYLMTESIIPESLSYADPLLSSTQGSNENLESMRIQNKSENSFTENSIFLRADERNSNNSFADVDVRSGSPIQQNSTSEIKTVLLKQDKNEQLNKVGMEPIKDSQNVTATLMRFIEMTTEGSMSNTIQNDPPLNEESNDNENLNNMPKLSGGMDIRAEKNSNENPNNKNDDSESTTSTFQTHYLTENFLSASERSSGNVKFNALNTFLGTTETTTKMLEIISTTQLDQTVSDSESSSILNESLNMSFTTEPSEQLTSTTILRIHKEQIPEDEESYENEFIKEQQISTKASFQRASFDESPSHNNKNESNNSIVPARKNYSSQGHLSTLFLHNNRFYVIAAIPDFYANFNANENSRTPIFSLQELQPIKPMSNVAVQKIEPFRIYTDESSEEQKSTSTQSDSGLFRTESSTTESMWIDIESEKSLSVMQNEMEEKSTVKVKKREKSVSQGWCRYRIALIIFIMFYFSAPCYT